MDSVAKTCAFEGCGRPLYGRGYCSAHWQQLRNTGTLKPIRVRRTYGEYCSVVGCGRVRETYLYCQTHYEDYRHGRNPVRKINSKRTNAIVRETCPVPDCESPEWSHGLCKAHVKLRAKFNCSDDMIVALYTDPRCSICGKPEGDPSLKRALHVDHDHSCCGPNSGCDNCIRGLLCASCNQGIGMFRDDTALLQSAISYLERSVR